MSKNVKPFLARTPGTPRDLEIPPNFGFPGELGVLARELFDLVPATPTLS